MMDKKRKISRPCELLRACVAGLLVVFCINSSIADTVDSTPRTISDLRVYPDGGLVFRFTPALTTAGCGYNDHSYTRLNAPGYKLVASLAITAFTARKPVLLIYNGCSSETSNINLTGLIRAE